MKKLSAIILFFTFCMINFKCSPPEECNQFDWIGIYTLSTDKECVLNQTAQGTLEFNDTIIIEAGSTANTILWDGVEVEFFECDVSVGSESIYIYGSNLQFTSGTCNATYLKS